MESISVVCQDDGFFEVPSVEAWETCLLGTTCEDPPDTPYEGTVTVTPQITEVEREEKCAVDGSVMDIRCPSFQQIYILGATYGREML